MKVYYNPQDITICNNTYTDLSANSVVGMVLDVLHILLLLILNQSSKSGIIIFYLFRS
jgi:hypothetical protein